MIVFGTDGWRGVIARDFTFDNLFLAAKATARYLVKKQEKNPSVVIGYDTRFLSEDFAKETAQVFASEGIIAHISDGISSTPQVSYHTKQKGASLGIVITASHNPPRYNGFKIKANFGGPATPEQIDEVVAELRRLEGRPPKMSFKSFDAYVEERLIRPFNAKEAYVRYLKKKIDVEAIVASNFKLLYDPMYGAGIDTMPQLIPNVEEIHNYRNPSFGEIGHPEPIQECLGALMEKVKVGKFDIGLATDGDADRIGAVDSEGNFVDSHKIYMILLKYIYEHKKKKGEVVKTVSLTSMVDMYCEKNSIPLHKTPVGFKHVAKLMIERPIIIGGEESGGLGTILHIPERDGIFNGLLLMEVMAKRKMSLKQLCDELDEEFGPHRYHRIDVTVTEAIKRQILKACAKGPKKIGRYDVVDTDNTDGYKFFVENGWLLVRASGTEPLIRFYSEADSMSKVRELLDAGQKLGGAVKK